MLRHLLICSFFLFGSVSGDPISTSFQELSKPGLVNQEIALRGFLYFNQDHWILAAESNLKSCCVGTIQKSNSQIILDSNLDRPPASKVVLIQGTLLFENGLFYLKNSKLIVDDSYNLFYFSAFFAIFLIVAYWFLKKVKALE